MRLHRAEVLVVLVHLSISLVGTLKVVSICWGLLQGCVRDVRLFMGLYLWLEEVRHKEDLQDIEREF